MSDGAKPAVVPSQYFKIHYFGSVDGETRSNICRVVDQWQKYVFSVRLYV